MIELLVLVIGVALGFVGSRQLRRTGRGRAPDRWPPPATPPARRPMTPSSVRPPFPLTATPPVAPSRPTRPPALVVVRRDTGQRMPLGAPTLSIGRSAERDLTIDDDRVSRSHAHLERQGNDWFVIDDGSANGTTVNRSTVPSGQRRSVKAGDRIGIGPFDLDVMADGGIESDDRTQVYRS